MLSRATIVRWYHAVQGYRAAPTQPSQMSPSPNISHLPLADVHPPRQIHKRPQRGRLPPPRHLWKGGGRQAGGEVTFPLAIILTSATGRCLFPHLHLWRGGQGVRSNARRSGRQFPHLHLWRGGQGVRSNARRSGRLPPRHLWRGGGRQAGGEVPIHFSCEDLDLVKALRIQYKVAPVHFGGKLECT